MDIRSTYRILVQPNGEDQPTCSLVEVVYNDDGSIASIMEPLFVAVDPAEILYDLGRAVEGAALPPITPKDVKGYDDLPDDLPF